MFREIIIISQIINNSSSFILSFKNRISFLFFLGRALFRKSSIPFALKYFTWNWSLSRYIYIFQINYFVKNNFKNIFHPTLLASLMIFPNVITIITKKTQLARTEKATFYSIWKKNVVVREKETARGILFSRLIRRINKSLLDEISLSSYQIIIAWANNQRCLFFSSQSRGIAISRDGSISW